MGLSLHAAARKKFPTKPYYDQLTKVLAALNTDAGIHRVHPTLMLALHRDRAVFDTMLMEWGTPSVQELEYFDLMHANGCTGRRQRPVHALIQALSSAMVQRMWQPTCLSQHLLVWQLYNPRRGRDGVITAAKDDDDAREAKLIRQLLSHYPNQHRHAFETFVSRGILGPQAARSLFPICIPTNGIVAFSKAILEFFLANRGRVLAIDRVFEQELQKQHPELWLMLNLHAQIYPNAQEACENSGALVEPLMRLSAGNPVVEHVELPEL